MSKVKIDNKNNEMAKRTFSTLNHGDKNQIHLKKTLLRLKKQTKLTCFLQEYFFFVRTPIKKLIKKRFKTFLSLS